MASPRAKLALFTLMALGLAGCGSSDKPAEGANPDTATDKPVAASMAVTLVKAQSQKVERAVLASGPITPWEEMQLGVELSGVRVTALNVDVGQQVRKGQVLLELDHRTLDSDLRSAQASYSEAMAGVQLAKVNLGRGQALAKSQLISASALDELRAALVQAEARAATTRAQRDGVQLRRDFAQLRAPDDGIISKRLVQPGQVVAAGGELLRLIRQGRLEWRPELPEADLARVAPGAPVEVRGADGAWVKGTVRAVSPGVDTATRTGSVHADLPDPGSLKAGAFVEGRIITNTSHGLMVPTASVVMRDGYAYVFTVDAKNIAHRVRVQTGVSDGDRIEILDGIVVGQTLVASGAGFLGDGDQVKVVAAPPTAADTAKSASKAGATP
jgi:RND family efflux transporter MFP subunit